MQWMVSLHDTTFVQTKKWNFLQPQQPWRGLGARVRIYTNITLPLKMIFTIIASVINTRHKSM